MFLLQVLRSRDIPAKPAELSQTATLALPGGYVAYASCDHFLGYVGASSDTLSVGERAPGAAAMPLVNVTLTTRGNFAKGTMERIAHSGRSLYYHMGYGGCLFVSSHLRFLMAAGVPMRETIGQLPELYLYRHVCPPRTLIEDVFQLAVGDTAKLTLEGANGWKVERIPGFMPPQQDQSLSGGAEDSAVVNAMRDALEAATLRPDERGDRVGCILSGGVDSSILTAVNAHKLGSSKSFSSAYPFEDAASDTEYRYATTAAKALGTTHEVYIPTVADYLHGVIDAIATAEIPVMHLQSVLVHLLCKNVLKQQGCTLVPCGEGADGMYGGRLQRLFTAFTQHPMRKKVLELPGVAPLLRTISRYTNRWGMIADLADRPWDANSPVTDHRHAIYTFAMFSDRRWLRHHLKCTDELMVRDRVKTMAPYAGRDPRDCVSILAFLSETAETQALWGRLAEAQGMCFTYPFQDPAVSDLTYRIPWEAKLRGSKPVARAAAVALGVPKDIVYRPKASFDIDPHKWASRGGIFEPLIPLAAPMVGEATLRELQTPYVFKAHTLWTVINYALWKRMFLNNETAKSLHAKLDDSMRTLGVAEAYAKPVVRTA